MKIIKDGVFCDDLLFQIINESMRKIETMILRLESESKALNNLSINLSSSERIEFSRRVHIAKTMIMDLDEDIEIKKEFLSKLKNKKFISKKFTVSSPSP